MNARAMRNALRRMTGIDFSASAVTIGLQAHNAAATIAAALMRQMVEKSENRGL